MSGTFLKVLVSFFVISSIAKAASNSTCRDNERFALLEFKKGLFDPTNRLSSWVGVDCCKWIGVLCNPKTGHVTKLKLRNPPPTVDDNKRYLGGNLSSSLLELKCLSYLDLSGNYFYGSNIPWFFGSMSRLRYLNLSDAGFRGKIPHQLGNLTNLRYLDLHRFYIPPRDLVVDSLDWLSQLSSLRYLDLSAINLAKVRVFDAINNLQGISVVILSNCGLDGIPNSLPRANFSHLSKLDLGMNNLKSIPEWFFGIKSLEDIDLSYNRLSGPVSDFGNLSSLQVLRLRYNNLNKAIPETIERLGNLVVLDLSSNGIDIDISKLLKGLSGRAMNNLQTLNLQNNSMTGKVPDWLGMFRNLLQLRLDHNFLSGSIPETLGNLSSLRYLYLGHNKLEGSVPLTLGQLSELVVLDLSFNSLRGSLSDKHLSNLTKLDALFLSSNSLNLEMSHDWIPSFQLKNIHLAFCVLGPQFPTWLKTQRSFSTINISNGSISDVMPDWFWSLSLRVRYLNLSHNQISGEFPASFTFSNILIVDLRSNDFHGPLPHCDDGVKYLYLSDNSFSGNLLPVLNNMTLGLSIVLFSNNLLDGSIPQSICGMISLAVLDLSSNLLSGEIPRCSSKVPTYLSAINLGNNNLSGDIPTWIGSLTYLKSLHLSSNNLHGKIPSLENCTGLYLLDLGFNKLEGKIPAWIGKKLWQLKMLRLRSNLLDGNIPNELSRLTSLQVLDLADNNLTGLLPHWLGNLTGMASTNQTLIYFYNPMYASLLATDYYLGVNAVYVESLMVAVKGAERKYSSTLYLVVSLDLSGNEFSGEIPTEITRLLGLQSLNLSDNHLKGNIPDKFGSLLLLETLDLSRNGLSGVIPSSISSLTFLNHLNLSHNNLSGRIPTGTQILTQDSSAFAGNPNLCGEPLPNKCAGAGGTPFEAPATDDSDGSETIWMYIGGGIVGFAAGFSGFLGTLLLNNSWKKSCYKLIDRILPGV